MRNIIAALSIAGLAVAGMPSLASAHGNHNHLNAHSGYYHPYDSPWQFPNCILWNPVLRNYVWICGSPYPVEMPHT